MGFWAKTLVQMKQRDPLLKSRLAYLAISHALHATHIHSDCAFNEVARQSG
jgi:hypothetical protein